MGTPRGYIELERTIDSITIGTRHRKDLGDIDALAASIAELDLLQPPTITPDGVLVCGARRLAALKKLGRRTVNVWVRSGISDQLGLLLAEQDDNVHHKNLTPVEAAALYRELKTLMAEDAQRRKKATQFRAGHNDSSDGPAKFAGPDTAPGEARQQAAAMIPGGASHTTLEKINYLREITADPDAPAHLRTAAQTELDAIDEGAPVHPAYQRIRAAAETSPPPELAALAQEALTRVTTGGTAPEQTAEPHQDALAMSAETIVQWPRRAFLATWSELENWWDHYDTATLAAELSDDEYDAFLATVDGTRRFAEQLRAARENPSGHTAGRHLHAL